MNKAQRLEKFLASDIYPVITGEFCAGRSSAEVCAAVLAGGARIVQLREKNLSRCELLGLAKTFRDLTSRARALLIINDHVDIALLSEADGVHLGQDDLPLAAVRGLVPEMLLGVSTHQVLEARQAEQAGADYINIGPVFPTATKTTGYSGLGPAAVSEISSCVKLPFTVMGGINQRNLEQVLAQGASRVAMVTGITQAPDVAARVRDLRQMMENFRR